MNDHMWEHPATRANVALLRERGVTIIDPGTGALASKGEWGAGRLAEPARLLAAVEALVPAGPRPWDGLEVLVTAGGTREPIDSVRFVGNRSSGRMGVALADEAAALGAGVTLVSANATVAAGPAVRTIEVGTAAELQAACEARFPAADVLLMAAAVADFRPAAPADTKLKKDGRATLSLELEATPDILGALAAARRPGQTIVGFAAEHGDGAVEHGRGKLARKGLDAIVVNDIARSDIGFEGDHNEVTIVTAAAERHVPRAGKAEVARAVLEVVTDLRRAERAPAT